MSDRIEKAKKSLVKMVEENGYNLGEKFIDTVLAGCRTEEDKLGVLDGLQTAFSKPISEPNKFLKGLKEFMAPEFDKKLEELKELNKASEENRTLWFKGLKDGFESKINEQLVKDDAYQKGYQKAQQDMMSYIGLSKELYPTVSISDSNEFVNHMKRTAEALYPNFFQVKQSIMPVGTLYIKEEDEATEDLGELTGAKKDLDKLRENIKNKVEPK